MNKQKLNYVIDGLALVSFVITAVSGLVILIFLPSGVRQGRFQEFMGITKVTWSTWHDWAGVILIFLVLAHLVLHWQWIVCMTKNIFGENECEVEKEQR